MNNFNLKRLGGADQPLVQKPWRVNLVQPALLPDIGVVRTRFLLNYGCVAVASVGLFLAISQELAIVDLHNRRQELDSKITSSAASDAKIREQSAMCAAYLGALETYSNFKNPGVDIMGLYAAVAAIRTDGIVFDSIQIDTASMDARRRIPRVRVVVAGKTQGITAASADKISKLYDSFYEMPYLKKIKNYKMGAKLPVNPVPEKEGNAISFTFELTMEPV